MKTGLIGAFGALTLLVGCGEPPPVVAPTGGPSASATPPSPKAGKATNKIVVSASSGTRAAPAGATPSPNATHPPTQYRIEPAASGNGYEAVEETDGTDGRRAPIAEAEVAKLVARAKTIGPKLCPSRHSPHHDPSVHFEGDLALDALGGLGLGCAPSAECDACRERFLELHEAVLQTVKRALP